MTNQDNNKDMNKVLFANLVMSLAHSAMQDLGKLVNPLTRKTEVNLEAAQATIDMLAMLRDKTTGNLDREEERMLGDLLASLQMNFVETSAASPPKSPEQPAAEAPPAPDSQQQGGVSGAAGSKPDQKDPKFHKSYGN